ncbi:hypothetical protein [Streptosporangium sp. 'caverna']|uniref:hypothetical protein n=1 Tax=Streptosporangium sp. 'caverna' TaxID=2202249 RepID=UPI000D7E57CB|nr:hypothetical protein [Streptosporangium sp. 'caverna']AWS43619.1 hypothetical protein DKM19_21845 [Streptosporangium sp. 'caverna']
MSRRRALNLGLLSIFALLLTVAMPQSANAYTANTWGSVAANSSYCIRGTAGIDHVVPGVWSSNQAWVYSYVYMGDCQTPLMSNQIRVKLQVQKTVGSSWVTLSSTNWMYGYMNKNGDLGFNGPSAYAEYGGAQWGAGWYRTLGSIEVYRMDVVCLPGTSCKWWGGTISSGNEWVE